MNTVHVRVIIRDWPRLGRWVGYGPWREARYRIEKLMGCGMVGGQTLRVARQPPGRILHPISLRAHRKHWSVLRAKGLSTLPHLLVPFHAVEGTFDRDRLGEVEDLPWVKGLSVVRVSERDPVSGKFETEYMSSTPSSRESVFKREWFK